MWLSRHLACMLEILPGWLSESLSLYSGQAVANLGWMLAIPIILLMLATPMYSYMMVYGGIIWYLSTSNMSRFSNDLVGSFPPSEAMNAHIMILFWRVAWLRWWEVCTPKGFSVTISVYRMNVFVARFGSFTRRLGRSLLHCNGWWMTTF